VINFLAPTDSDRFFETASGPQNLGFSGILPSPLLRVEDGWQKMRVTLHAPGSQEFWSLPSKPFRNPKADSSGFIRVHRSWRVASDFVQHYVLFGAVALARGGALAFRLGSVTSWGYPLLGEFPIPAAGFLP